MTDVFISWSNPTVDTVGAPVTITAVVVFRDGVALASVSPLTESYVHGEVAGPHVYSVRADTDAGVGTMSAEAEIIVPTGIAAAPGNVLAVLL